MASKLTTTEHLKSCASSAKNFANRLISTLAGSVTAAIEEMDSVKSDKPAAAAATIPTSGWVSDSSVSGYKYRYDLTAAGVTANDFAVVAIAPASQNTAVYCGLCPTNETFAGEIRFRSAGIPSAAISVKYWIEQGKGN